MNTLTNEAMLRMTYEVTYDYLKKHPGFDGRPHPDHPGALRTGVDPEDVKPWPGAADVHRQSRDEWVEARLEAVRRGDEDPALRLSPGAGR